MVHRIKYYWSLLWWGVWRMILPPIGLVGIYDTVTAQFFPDKDLPTVSKVISWWDWRYWVILFLVVAFLALAEGIYRREKNKGNQTEKGNIKQVVEELLNVGIYSDVPVNITRILYHDRDKLAGGLLDREVSVQDKRVLVQLSLRNIVKLEQRQRVVVRGPYDEGYWVLTELGNDVILYLEGNKQILDEVGVQSDEQVLVITLQAYAIGLSGMTGYPKKPRNKRWLCLEGIVYPGDSFIETLDLLLDGQTIHANDWPGKSVAALRVQFDVSGWERAGQKQIELVARVRGIPHRLGREHVDFDVEPFGHHPF